MSDGYIVRHGGAGGGLNFRVICNTIRPSLLTSRENDIWVNTDVQTKDWQFSSQAPTEIVPNMLWIATSNTSSVAFDAIKKNNVFLYPKNCNQRIGNAWVPREMQVFLNGTWKSMSEYLYYLGDLRTELSGGWAGRRHGGGTFFPTIENTAEYYHIRVNSGNSLNYTVFANNNISLAPYRHIKLWYTSDMDDARQALSLGVSDGFISSPHAAKKIHIPENTDPNQNPCVLDISDINSILDVGIIIQTSKVFTLNMYKLELVP